MSFMFEVYYRPPADSKRESELNSCVAKLGGRLDFREESAMDQGAGSICLTFEFDRLDQAEAAAKTLHERGEHVEGPQEYDREPSHA